MEYFIISHNLMLCMNWWRDADTIILRLLTAFLNDLELKLCCLHFILNKCNPNSIPSLYACKKSVWLWLKCKQISKNVKVFVKINYARNTLIKFTDYLYCKVSYLVTFNIKHSVITVHNLPNFQIDSYYLYIMKPSWWHFYIVIGFVQIWL